MLPTQSWKESLTMVARLKLWTTSLLALITRSTWPMVKTPASWDSSEDSSDESLDDQPEHDTL